MKHLDKIMNCTTLTDLHRAGYELGDYRHAATYQGRYFGETGDDLGDVDIVVYPVYPEGDTSMHAASAWMVAELSSPGSIEVIHGYASDLTAAVKMAEAKAAKLDESDEEEE